jgi:hypothetical protein
MLRFWINAKKPFLSISLLLDRAPGGAKPTRTRNICEYEQFIKRKEDKIDE